MSFVGFHQYRQGGLVREIRLALMDGDTDVDIEIDIQKKHTMARGEGKKSLECKIAEILWVAE